MSISLVLLALVDNYLSLNSLAVFHAILARLVPASWTVTALAPGYRLLVGLAAVLFAVVAGCVIASRALAAAFGDDILIIA